MLEQFIEYFRVVSTDVKLFVHFVASEFQFLIEEITNFVKMSEIHGLSSLMQKLAVHDKRPSTLLEIKSFIAALPLSALKNVIQASDLLPLFDCMNTENKYVES